MDRTKLLCCVILVSIALHAQAMKGNSELERFQPALGRNIKEMRDGPDHAKIRADAVDKLLDSLEDATTRWRDLEATFAEFLADSIMSITISAFTAFLDAETSVGISASNILPVEVEAIEKMYQSAIKAIEVSRDREEFFHNEINLLKQWRRLTQINKFQIPECEDYNNAALINAYNMEMFFTDLEIIARGYSFALESCLSNVYQEWVTCLLSEIAGLQQDPKFSGFECEAGIAAGMKQVSFHISLVLDKLEKVGAELDVSLATFKTAIKGVEGGCYPTGRMLAAVDVLISVGVFRRENEMAFVAMNQSFFDAFQRWLDFFTATKGRT